MSKIRPNKVGIKVKGPSPTKASSFVSRRSTYKSMRKAGVPRGRSLHRAATTKRRMKKTMGKGI